MKKPKKLAVHKVTVLDLDEPTMQGIAAGAGVTLDGCPSGACPFSTATFCCTKLPTCP